MHRDGEHLRVIVEDNGVGFAPDKLGASSGKMEGFGLFSIRERLNYFGGRMEIESTPGEVTRVILTLPLQPDKKKRPSRMATPTPVRVSRPACGAEGSIPAAGKTPASLLARRSVSLSRPARPRAAAGGLKPAPVLCGASLTARALRVRLPPQGQVGKRPALSLARYPARNPILSFAPKSSIIITEA